MTAPDRFLSTLSLRRATSPGKHWRCKADISIHALLAESDLCTGVLPHNRPCISIHALLAESDATLDAGGNDLSNFYPRSPCGERRACRRSGEHGSRNFYPRSPCGERRYTNTWSATTPLFLSTLSLRRATLCTKTAHVGNCNFYPRSPCGERLTPKIPACSTSAISIHALLAESDFLPGCLFDSRS